METVHHFKCIDLVIDSTNKKLPEKFIKALYHILKSRTSVSRLSWFVVVEDKRLPNGIGGIETILSEYIAQAME